MLFGVFSDAIYPAREFQLRSGDRFLLYIDGVVEPENAAGDSFGESKREEVICNNQLTSPSDLTNKLLSEIRRWQPASMPQQDDITLIVVDVE